MDLSTWCANLRPGLVTGLAAEARIAGRLAAAAAGGGQPAGAALAAERLVAEGATALVSFGLCGGLDPRLGPGAIVVPRRVLSGNDAFPCSVALGAALGGMTHEALLAADAVIPSARAKWTLFQSTGAAAVDLESGAVARVAARHGLPFAVLRAVCDPASLDLPPAALLALDANGAVAWRKLVASLLARPAQLAALITLARAAARARAALVRRVGDIGRGAFL
jgi:adenosylhomocysteine nucleosidase